MEIMRLKKALKACQRKLDLTEAFLEAPQTGSIDGAASPPRSSISLDREFHFQWYCIVSFL
jgi:hypothetical protein